eukprot:gene13023-biopygen8623
MPLAPPRSSQQTKAQATRAVHPIWSDFYPPPPARRVCVQPCHIAHAAVAAQPTESLEAPPRAAASPLAGGAACPHPASARRRGPASAALAGRLVFGPDPRCASSGLLGGRFWGTGNRVTRTAASGRPEQQPFLTGGIESGSNRAARAAALPHRWDRIRLEPGGPSSAPSLAGREGSPAAAASRRRPSPPCRRLAGRAARLQKQVGKTYITA